MVGGDDDEKNKKVRFGINQKNMDTEGQPPLENDEGEYESGEEGVLNSDKEESDAEDEAKAEEAKDDVIVEERWEHGAVFQAREPFDPGRRKITGNGNSVRALKPYTLFTRLWTPQMWNLIHDNTQSRDKSITMGELKLFFAIVLRMGILGMRRQDDYWALKVHGVSEFMNQSDFQRIKVALRCHNLQDLRLRDPRRKVVRFLRLLSHAFESQYELGTHVVVDEIWCDSLASTAISHFILQGNLTSAGLSCKRSAVRQLVTCSHFLCSHAGMGLVLKIA